jgi:hypothetical protein
VPDDDVTGDMERARALAAAAEGALAAAEAAARVVQMAAARRASREERAAVRIQAYYRGYLVSTCHQSGQPVRLPHSTSELIFVRAVILRRSC